MTKEVNYKELLEVGQVYNNYKLLCDTLGEKYKKGDSRVAQFKNWDMYFSHTKKGHKITITEIHLTPLDKLDNRKGGNNKVQYIPLIENLILDLLVNSKTENLFLSKNMMLRELKMVNSNYTYGKRYPNRASKELDVERELLNDFYQISDAMLKRNLDTSLESLKDKALISCDMVITVGIIDTSIDMNKGNHIKGQKEEKIDYFGDKELDFRFTETKYKREHRRATKQERDAIRDAERAALIALGLESKKEIFSKGKNDDFYKLVTDRLFKEYSIYVYYNSYEISFNPDYVLEEKAKQDMLLEGYMRLNTQVELNTGISEKMTLNANHRNRKASNMFTDTRKEKYRMRMAFAYVDNSNKLIKNFISIDEDILKEMNQD